MTGQSDEVQVHRRFRGPPTSGNGGYVAGLVAEWIDGPAEVDLLAPIPLEVPLHRRRDDAEVMLFDAQANYARGRPLDDPFDFEVPGPPTEDELEAAAMSLPGAGRPSDPRLLRLRYRARTGRRSLHLSRRKSSPRRRRGRMDAGRGVGRRGWPYRGALPLGGARLPQLFRPVRAAAAGAAGANCGADRPAGVARRAAAHHRLGIEPRGPQASQPRP